MELSLKNEKLPLLRQVGAQKEKTNNEANLAKEQGQVMRDDRIDSLTNKKIDID